MSRTFTLHVGRSSTFSASTLLINETVPNSLSRLVPNRELPYGVTLYARVKCTDDTTGTSSWSPTITFKVRNPAKIVGVCLDTKATPGVFTWIDEDGNQVANFEYQNHPTFYNSSMVTVTEARNSVMTRIPRFYIRTATSGPVGSYAEGKKCWWISDIPTEGYRPHPAFKRYINQVDEQYILADYIYIGTYLGSDALSDINTTMLVSKKGSTPVTMLSIANFRSRCNTINSSNNTRGYHLFDIWDASAVKLLGLIAAGNGNSEETFGTNTTQATGLLTGATKSKLVLQGTVSSPIVWIDDLWAYYNYFVDGLSTHGTIQLTSPMDGSSILTFGSSDTTKYTPATMTYAQYYNDVMDCPVLIGNDTHDLMELFIPKAFSSNYSTCAFTDHGYVSTENKIARMGGLPREAGTTAGLFNLLVSEESSTISSTIGARLARYY